ncbi:MAG: magnesium transporter [Caulobacteraceae bacterium]|nr:magnesium transporter [Caulobacteraceae bacterium]
MLTAYPQHANTPDRLHEAIWIDLLSPTEEEIAAAEAAIGLKVPTREELSAIEASSRLQRVGKALSLSTPLMAGLEAPHLSPAGFVLTETHLLTVRFDKFVAFDAAAVHALEDEDEDELTSLGVFTCLFEAIVDRVADLLEAAAAELDQVSRSVFHSKQRKRDTNRSELFQRNSLSKVGRIGERLSLIRDVLLGVGRIVPFVLEVRHAPAPDPIAARLKAVRQDILSLNDYEGHLANKVQFLLDAVLGFITISQNDIFKVLTVASIVGIPPTLMAGVYGMNFKVMPELNWTLGYPFGLLVIVTSALIPLAWFKWKGWL